ncbi:MAG TPA: hypothetical protein VHH91_00115 [Vicinamibacterales bacterium]|jgi:hypothetical protein|nr:hypothetical protein [Vicinamibacterales bacterium]
MREVDALDLVIPVRVECYAGHRGEETPRAIWLADRRIDVAVVVDRWLGPDHRYFKLECDAGDTYIVRHDVGRDTWELTMFRAGTLK